MVEQDSLPKRYNRYITFTMVLIINFYNNTIVCNNKR